MVLTMIGLRKTYTVILQLLLLATGSCMLIRFFQVGVTCNALNAYDGTQYFARADLYRKGLEQIFIYGAFAAISFALCLALFPGVRKIINHCTLAMKRTPGWVFWLVIPLVSVVLNAWSAKYVIGGVPRVFDAFNYWFQAKNFSLGQFYAEVPPLKELFAFPFIIMRQGKWYGSVYPGWPLLLSTGMGVNLEWLISPVMGGLTLMVLFHLTRDMVNEPVARLVVLLGALSPFTRMMSSIFMSHSAAMFWVTVALWSLWRWGCKAQNAEGYYPLLAGVALGWIYLTRPQAGAVTLPAMCLWVIYRVRWCGWRRLLLFATPLMIAVIFLGVYNCQLTGDPMINPRYFVDPGRSLGFGKSLGIPLADGLRSGHDFVRGLKNAEILLNLLNAEITGWGAFSITGWFTILWVIVLFRQPREPRTWILSSAVFLNLLLYIFYFTPSPNFGPRYLSESIPVVLILMGCGIYALFNWGQHQTDSVLRSTVGLTVVFLSVIAIGLMIPLQITHYGILPDKLDHSAIPQTEENAIVLIPEKLHCMNIFTWNSPDLNGRIFLPLREHQDIKTVCDVFSDRTVYVLEMNHANHARYRVRMIGSQ